MKKQIKKCLQKSALLNFDAEVDLVTSNSSFVKLEFSRPRLDHFSAEKYVSDFQISTKVRAVWLSPRHNKTQFYCAVGEIWNLQFQYPNWIFLFACFKNISIGLQVSRPKLKSTYRSKHFLISVPWGRFELPCLATHAPEACAATNYATTAIQTTL